MAFDPQGFQLADAVSSGQDIYEVPFLSWGVRTVAAGATAVNPNFQFPPPGQAGIPNTIAGIAIGPRSSVDRAWVSWARQKPVTPGGPVFGPFDSGLQTTRVRPFSLGHPLMFSQPAGSGSVPTAQAFTGIYNPNNSPTLAMQTGLLYVWPKEPTPFPGSDMGADVVCTTAQSTTILPAQYADQAGNTWALSTAATAFCKFYAPLLELYLYLKPPLFSSPTARFPLLTSDSIIVTVTGSYQPSVLVPIFGRKNVTVAVRANTGGKTSTTFRIGLINCIRENAPTTTSPPFEWPGGTSAALADGATAVFQIANPCSDYLVVYTNTSSNPTTADIQVSAYD